MAILLSDSNVPINLENVSPQANRVLSSAKLCIGYLDKEKEIINGKVEQNSPNNKTLIRH